ncbi:MAG: hypothetical protein QNJ46_23725 [Leptolyngbyaceae cyanobacterium MO_188.B28]|nr:hypothetical protein [Leptolyngbyaceae cyanobacterium MO_188.B28]
MAIQKIPPSGKPERYRGYLIQAVRKEGGWSSEYLPLKHLKQGYISLSRQIYSNRSRARLAARKALLWHEASQQIAGWLYEVREQGAISPQEYRRLTVSISQLFKARSV